jgi:integrase
MARGEKKLTPLKVSAIKEPGMYGDGLGLWLQVSPTKTKSWVFRFMLNGKSREMGLGSIHTFSLAEAREKARECRQLLAEGVDPIEARNAKRTQTKLDAAKVMTFDECAKAYIEAHRAGWSNAKHVYQWEKTLLKDAGAILGPIPVQGVDTSLVLKVLEPVWYTKNETANRLRGRIESVLDWAKTRGLREGDNPARWKGHIDNLLPAPSKIQKVEHHAALPYVEMGEFMAQLRTQEGIGALALEFLILTAARTGEVIGAEWEEFDLDTEIWTVPPTRMKAKKEHRVPLSPRALVIVKTLKVENDGGFVFPGARAGKPLSNMAMLALLRRMGRGDLTSHGFRSTFKDWCAECTAFANEISEAALAHVIENKVEKAYRRGDLFEKRRLMMNDWAKHCEKTGIAGAVIPIRKGGEA